MDSLFSVYHKTSFTRKHVMIMITAAWLFGPLFNLARYIPTTRIIEGKCIFHMVWPNRFWFSVTSVMVCILYLIFPLIFILGLYISIFLMLRKRASAGKLGEGNERQSNVMDKAKANVLKTSIFLTTCYFLCWTWNLSFVFLLGIGITISTSVHFIIFLYLC